MSFSESTLPLLSNTICLLQRYIAHLGCRAQIHFELEGCNRLKNSQHKLNFDTINQHLQQMNIDGEIISEYWQNQWEYVSLFNGQSPLKEAQNLHQILNHLPQWFKAFYSQHGLVDTLIQPVVWSGDKGKLVLGSTQIFSDDSRAVHIPNAIQLNVSILDDNGNNLIANKGVGEYLQYCFLRTSLECCLLYLPDNAAFERLTLKTRYGLAQELCSPIDISGGHQGSIALYQKLGKHNQQMGAEPLLYDHHNQVLSVQQNWQKTARIEHRLGAASLDYNPYLNVIYALLNVIDTLESYKKNQHLSAPELAARALPRSLMSDAIEPNSPGAVELFKAGSWFSRRLNLLGSKAIDLKFNKSLDCPLRLGDKIKQIVLDNYQTKIHLHSVSNTAHKK